MNQRLPHRAGLLIAGILWAPIAASAADEQTCTLELKRFGSSMRVIADGAIEGMLRMSHSQHFWAQPGMRQAESEEEFPKVITKQPEYKCETPFRGVARLGSQKFGFVLDSTDLKKKGYDRLWFDLNHNGDLTDEEVIKAQSDFSMWSGSSTSREFPRTDVTVDVDGTKLDYSFFFSVYSQFDDNYSYMSASLSPGVYREGKLELDGKDRRIFLADFNSNGRFDDLASIDKDVTYSGGGIYARPGDMLFIDPQPRSGYYNWYDVTSGDDHQQLSKIATIDGKFYDVTVSPSGDKLTLKPSEAAVGYVTNPNKGYRAVVYNDQGGFIKIGDADGKPVALPEGEWKLLNYTIDRTKKPEPAGKPAEEEKKAKRKSVFARLAERITGTGDSASPSVPEMPQPTMVSASGTKDYKPVKVTKGQTVEMPFGPPYKPLVTVDGSRGDRQYQLSMLLTGSAGEVCTNLTVEGDRPPDPVFTVATAKGEIVERGAFEYG